MTADLLPEDPGGFSGYRWTYHSSMQEGPRRVRICQFLETVDWHSLQQYAITKRNGVDCKILPDIGLGGIHVVRIIEFDDGIRWIARLRMPPLDSSDGVGNSPAIMELREQSEYTTMSLVRQKTNIPVPEVHAVETSKHNSSGAPFMMIDCLPGNVGIDLSMEIPSVYNQNFIHDLARIHVELSTIRLPKIGTIVGKNDDGTYQQGPIRGIGGPFDTATEFFKAWAANAKFGLTEERLRAASGPYADEVASAVATFPTSIDSLASKLSAHDHGPFQLCHGDYGHNNIIIDEEWRVLGVIDWEFAFAAPWEIFADFPLNLSVVPAAMDAPCLYDERGDPKDSKLAQKLADQRTYVAAIKHHEEQTTAGSRLSAVMEDKTRQHMAAAIRLFEDGKAGFYSKLVHHFKKTYQDL